MKKSIRVLLVDDHFTARLGLSVPINGEPDMQVVGEAENAAQSLKLYRKHLPDVVIMDYKLPDRTGVEATEEIRAEFPEARILMLTVFDGEEDIYRAVIAGASGYLTKSASRNEVLRAIRTIASGKKHFPADLEAKLRTREKREPLIPREVEILHHIVRGQANKEIASSMKLSVGTINLHISKILEKLGAPDRTRAVTLAIERGIVRLGE